jgi:carboxylesterase type B
VGAAGHATELAYLYPMDDGGAVAAGFTPDERQTADTMARYWGAFVIHGEPAATDLPAWPAYAVPENFETIIIFRSSQPRENTAERARRGCRKSPLLRPKIAMALSNLARAGP